jgi:hypothetical protein
MKLLVAFSNFSNLPKKKYLCPKQKFINPSKRSGERVGGDGLGGAHKSYTALIAQSRILVAAIRTAELS